MREPSRTRLFEQVYATLDNRRVPDGPWTLTRVYLRAARGGPNAVYRARDGETGQLVAVKANARPAVNRQQFNALRRLRAVTEAAVTPLALAPDQRFFVMEWYDAPLLLERMHDADRTALLAGAARWLAALHAATAQGDARDPFLDDTPLLPPEACPGQPEVADRLAARHAALPRKSGPIALLHTDYQLHNLFDVGGRLIAFDRARDRTGLVHFDIARFLLGAELYRALAAADGAPWPGDIDTDRQSFWSAYGALPPDQLALYDFVEDLLLARLWRFFSLRRDNPRAQARAACLAEMMRHRALLDPAGPRPVRLVRRRLGPAAPVGGLRPVSWSHRLRAALTERTDGKT